LIAGKEMGAMDRRLRSDLLLGGGVLLAALALFLLFRPGGAGAWVVVTVDGVETARCGLSEERTLTIGEDAYNVLKISNGMAAVVEANCGDHTCIRTGAISREGETIVCLPHRMVVRVEGGEGAPFDAAVR
jgi:hypothetical protein